MDLHCITCQKSEKDLSVPLKKCAKCGTNAYCSRKCQKKDWKVHKIACATTSIAERGLVAIAGGQSPSPMNQSNPDYCPEICRNAAMLLNMKAKDFHIVTGKSGDTPGDQGTFEYLSAVMLPTKLSTSHTSYEFMIYGPTASTPGGSRKTLHDDVKRKVELMNGEDSDIRSNPRWILDPLEGDPPSTE